MNVQNGFHTVFEFLDAIQARVLNVRQLLVTFWLRVTLSHTGGTQ
jgi:hypothetical protein